MEILNVEKEYRMRDLAMFTEDILLAWQDEICSGCWRTKRTCQEAGGSGCDLR